MKFSLNLNGGICSVDVPPETTLLTVLRDELSLTGAHYGCGHGVCGACFVLIDDKPAASCTLTIDQTAGHEILTIEGLARNGTLHPLQRAFIEEDAMQCGYCTGGMILSAVALLARNARPTDTEIRDALAPHLCRCGVYLRALRAVKRAIS